MGVKTKDLKSEVIDFKGGLLGMERKVVHIKGLNPYVLGSNPQWDPMILLPNLVGIVIFSNICNFHCVSMTNFCTIASFSE